MTRPVLGTYGYCRKIMSQEPVVDVVMVVLVILPGIIANSHHRLISTSK